MAAPSDPGDGPTLDAQSDDPALTSSGAEVRHDASTYLHNFLPGTRARDGVMTDKAMFWAMMATAAILFWLHCMMLVWERTQGVGQ